MRKEVFVAFFCLFLEFCSAQPFGVLKHFSHDVKLSQSHILDIQQDKKGFIWLGTYNGLIRYDGNTFKNFEVLQGGKLNLSSNRVSSFQFDKSERIWIKSEQNEVYYFDSRTLNFHYPVETYNTALESTSFKDFRLMPSGRVWLYPENKNQLVLLENNEDIKLINFDFSKLGNGKIQEIFEDSTGTTWFLTNFGICRLKKKSVQPEYLFFNMTRPSGKSYSFKAVTEINDELWFGGTDGKMIRYSKKSSAFFDVPLENHSDIEKIKYLSGDKILIVSQSDGFAYYDIKSGKLKNYNSNTLPGFPVETIKYMGLTHGRQFWFEGTNSGIYQFDLMTGKLKHMQVDFSDPSAVNIKRKTFFLTAADGTVWIQPKDGSFSYWDEKKNQLFSISHCMKQPIEEVSDVMHAATFDHLGNLWFCSYRKGLDLMIFKNKKFKALTLESSKNRQKRNVRSVMQERNGTLWVACRNQKITLFDKHKKKIGFLGADGTLSAGSPSWGADIYHTFQDRKGRIWVGTRGNGLFCLIPTQKTYSYKVLHYKYNEFDKYSISANDIYKIYQTISGHIFLATWGGGLNLIRESNDGIRFINYRNEWKKYPIKTADRVRSIVENKQQQLFFISSHKLFSFSDKNKTFTQFHFKEFPQVSGNDILDIMITSENKLALATNGKGVQLADLDDKGELKIQSFGEEYIGFPMDEVVAIQEDKSGKIWLMGDNQLVRFDAKKKTAETFPEIKSLLGNEIFSEATKYLLSNGEIIVGYSDGAVYFNPDNLKPLAFKPYLAITGFSVNNKELYEINQKMSANPDLLEAVTLEHDQNFLRIQFSALDYVKNENIVYRYKLKGVDKQWNYIKGSQFVNYTNLGRGEYKLLISSTNNHNLWVNNDREISIVIRPSIWWSNLALIVYLLLGMGLFILVRRTISTILKLRNDVQIEKQLSELKLKFFTDISHEIRTPLTMITAPVEKMLADNEVPETVKKQLELVERSTNRLLNLVNQILDLRRIQNRKLEVKEINLGHFAAKMCDNFREISLQRKIHLKLKVLAQHPFIWVDTDSLDKIMVNLVSNAFKYCRSGDTIVVLVDETDNQVILKIRDNGPGISPVLQKRLFVRFSNYNENPHNPSTGIGLSIVKDLVEKHHATITVNSTLGQGTCFQLNFSRGYKHFGDEVAILFEETGGKNEIDNQLKETLVATKEEEEEEEKQRKDKFVGLIVEDDPELQSFIVSMLQEDYTVHVAGNGIEGHLKAARLNPDFIISDVMMPQMDGIEMLRLIRNNILTSHIPVILLSAKTAIDTKLEGLEYGADEYLEKPFNVSYLKARIKNVLEQRKRLQLLYSSGNVVEISNVDSLQISNQDHKFMFEVIKLVKENISKTNFSVEELGKLMRMSRASFFNKLKDLTGVSPVVFIRDIRLNEAAEMLKKDDLLIKEICFEVGFTDLKYFGKCFKSKFNYSPAQYRRLYK
ncbi:response regulator [Flavobacterium sp. ST-87]|uniref:histidine kinase n=1 Tax=Flavobacterium plantiphilum TaxID=3163297 RepID=A0ABW8XVS4_9FLAO